MSANGVSKLNATNSSVELAAQVAVNANWMRASSRAWGRSNILGSLRQSEHFVGRLASLTRLRGDVCAVESKGIHPIQTLNGNQ